MTFSFPSNILRHLETFDELIRPQPTVPLVLKPEELIIFDETVDTACDTIADIAGSRKRAQFEVVSFPAKADGMDQVTAILASRKNIAALHLITNSENGINRLGTTRLFADNLAGYAGDLANWQDAFTGSAEILLYGLGGENPHQTLEFRLSIEALTGIHVETRRAHFGFPA